MSRKVPAAVRRRGHHACVSLLPCARSALTPFRVTQEHRAFGALLAHVLPVATATHSAHASQLYENCAASLRAPRSTRSQQPLRASVARTTSRNRPCGMRPWGHRGHAHGHLASVRVRIRVCVRVRARLRCCFTSAARVARGTRAAARAVWDLSPSMRKCRSRSTKCHSFANAKCQREPLGTRWTAARALWNDI